MVYSWEEYYAITVKVALGEWKVLSSLSKKLQRNLAI